MDNISFEQQKSIPSKLRLILTVIAGVFALIWCWGVFYAFDVYFNLIRDEFHQSYKNMAWVQSITAALVQFGCFPVSILTLYVPSRYLIGIGMTFITFAYFTSSLVTHLWNLYLSYGALCGLGGSLILLPSIGVVNSYSEFYGDRMGLILGIVQSGSGLGTLITTPINDWMLNHVSWKTALKYTSFAAGICGILMTIILKDYKRQVVRINVINEIKIIFNKKIYRRNILCMIFALPLLFLGYWTVFVFVAPYIEHACCGKGTAASIVSLMGVTNNIGVLFFGWLTDKIDPKYVLIFCIILKAGLTTVFVFVTNEILLYVIFLTVGLVAGCVSLVPKVCLEYFNPNNFTVVLGLCVTMMSFGSVLGQPMFGFLISKTDDWIVPGIFAGGCILLSALPLSLLSRPVHDGRQGTGVNLLDDEPDIN